MTTTFTIRVSYILFFTFLCWSNAFSQTFEIDQLGTEVYDSEQTGKVQQVDVNFVPGAVPTPMIVEVIDGYVLIEGDIILGTEKEILGGRAAIINLASRQWPNSTIPYTIEAGYPESNMIFAAINHITNHTNLCIIPRTNETNYIEFVNASGCASYIGMEGGKQPIWINPACGVGSTIHELLHAAGHYHEQSRADRDTYVSINTNNIRTGKEHNFNQYSSGMDLGAYDYASIMHYSPFAFSDNSQPTIEVKTPPGNASTNIGQRVGMSTGDINAVNQIYTAIPSCSDILIPANLSCRNMGTLTINGGVVTIAGFEVENTGGTSIGASTAYFYYLVGNAATAFGTATVPALTAGATHTLETTADLSALPDGTYPIGVWINVAESPTEATYRDNNFRWNAPLLSLSTPTNNCPADSLTLVALYNAMDGINWTNTWDLNQPMNTWYGVTTNSTGCVTTLNLGNNQLTNVIPPEIGDLIYAETIHLDNNQLQGSIPIEIGQLANVKELLLNHNGLTGTIPSEIGNLASLIKLRIHDADLSGSIPASIGDLSNLEYLYLYDNDLSGSIPASIGNLTNLKELYLLNNDLSGSLPSSIGNLVNLQFLYLNNNELSGAIPAEVGNLNNLLWLFLFNNQLTGSIPNELTDLPNLLTVWLHNNQLSGCFSPSLLPLCTLNYNFSGNSNLPGNGDFAAFCANGTGACSDCSSSDSLALVALHTATNPNGTSWTNNWDLTQPVSTWYGITTNSDGCVTEVDLRANQLSGAIPVEIGNLANLEQLYLFNNELTGSIPTEIGNLANLKRIYLYNNELTGSIPTEIGNLSNLLYLHLFDNQLTGSIPTTIGNLVNLQYLNLSKNQLIGTIPTVIGNLIDLEIIYLESNQLTGSIPVEIGNLVKLKHLYLYFNQLSGTIPVEIGNLQNLEVLNLIINPLTGTIPVEIGNLSNLSELYLNNTSLSGTIPAEIGNLTNLTRLRIYNTQVSGIIPVEIGNLINLQELLFQNNNLTGSIPESFGNLINLQALTINNNQLSGCFPENLTALCTITYNFSNNPSLPGGGDFAAFCADGTGACDDPVWPGDFNKDGIVNNADALYWGLACENAAGPVRPSATSNWIGQESPNWINAVNGVNNKHQDGDGNGIINIQDLQVLMNNYGLTRSVVSADNTITDGATYQLKPVPYTGTTTLEYELYIEQDGAPISLHGIACTIDFGDLPVLSASLDVTNSSINPDQHIAIYDATNNTMDIALTRTSKTNQIANGPAGTLIIIVDNIASGEPILLKTKNGGKIIANGTYKRVGNASLYDTYSDSPSSSSNLFLAASATHEKCDQLGAAEIFIVGGVAPYTINWSTGDQSTKITNLPAATYSVEVMDANGLSASYIVEIEKQFTPIYDENGIIVNCDPITISECLTNIYLENNITNGVYQAGATLNANGPIPSGNNTTFKAGESITLSTGFQVLAGATFLAMIEDCTPTFQSNNPNKFTYRASTNNKEVLAFSKKLAVQIDPNPLRDQGTITYELPTAGLVNLKIMNVEGELIRVLLNNVSQTAGSHQIELAATDLPKGLYFLSIQTKDEMKTRKFILLE